LLAFGCSAGTVGFP